MTKGSELPLRSLAEGFPVKPKLQDGDYLKGVVAPMGTKIHTFWTNFSRKNHNKYEILEEDPRLPGYWSFKTNLEFEDLDNYMLPSAVKSFLYQMCDIYRSASND